MDYSARWFETNIRSIEAELDSVQTFYEHQKRVVLPQERAKARTAREKALFRQLIQLLEQDYAQAMAYWRTQLTLALSTQQQHHQAADGLCELGEVPVQCKAATLSPTAFMNAGPEPQLKH